jgi:signal transduction histidine kinase
LITAVADNRQFIPFTWAISRLFNAGVLLAGTGVLLIRDRIPRVRRWGSDLRFVLLISILFGLVGFAVVYFCATRDRLPDTVFPDAVVKRPWDIGPLILFLIAGGFVFPRFHGVHPSLFSHALIVSVVPQVAAQMHAAFGSATLYDNHSNIASFLKIVAYVVPLLGLMLDYTRTYRAVQQSNELLRAEIAARKRAERKLAQQAEALARSNADLEQFAYAASHDLQEPLRAVSSYMQLLGERYRGQLDAGADKFIGRSIDAADRMRTLIDELLEYARLTTRSESFRPVDCSAVVDQVLENLKVAVQETGAEITRDVLPTVTAEPTQLARLFQNLLSNAVKFRGDAPARIHISAEPSQGGWRFAVRDSGIGIAPEDADRIFLVFQRLHTRTEYPGTGMGLAICKKIVEHHGGRIWVESLSGKGSTFYFTIPDRQRDASGGREPSEGQRDSV